eukprot:Skav207972  [mRNA]  locus=scaffold495:49115:49336:+ [translate_table: standard]
MLTNGSLFGIMAEGGYDMTKNGTAAMCDEDLCPPTDSVDAMDSMHADVVPVELVDAQAPDATEMDVEASGNRQ